MSKLLKLLLGLLFPGVDDAGDAGGDDAGDAGGDDSGGDTGAAGDGLDDLEIDLVEDEPTPAARGTEADRLARLEAEVERRGRAVEESRRTQAPPVDQEFQREEERLRNPETTEMERWQIQANRTLRQTQLEASRARMEASDLMDRTRFESKFNSDPRRAKYADRVEEAIQQERSQGRSASREAVYYYMLGKDIADGKLKPKAKAKTPAADVPRGRPANTRSDVQGRGRATEHDKRRARLENQNI